MTNELEFEDPGDPICRHQIFFEDITDGDSRFIKWYCECGLVAYEFIGFREWTGEYVAKAARVAEPGQTFPADWTGEE